MPQVITWENYTPPPRYDGDPWTEVRIEEAVLSTGPWVQIDVFTLTPVDPDPRFPASRDVTTALATDTVDLWYRLIFADAAGNTILPTYPIQNTPARIAYATVEELAGILRVSTTGREDALRRVLEAAAAEIDAELGLAEPYGAAPPLVTEVNLERAVEHWQQQQSPFAVLGLGGDFGPITVARDTWDRHAHKLAPLKESWGIG
jgi:hypothetical protein